MSKKASQETGQVGNAAILSAYRERDPILVPDNVLALLPGHENIRRAVAIHIGNPDLISRLVLINAVFREISLPVVFEPGENPGILGTNHDVRIAIPIDIGNRQSMRTDHSIVDRVRRPGRRFKPDHARPVPAASQEIQVCRRHLNRRSGYSSRPVDSWQSCAFSRAWLSRWAAPTRQTSFLPDRF